jgi:hypothetical protein
MTSLDELMRRCREDGHTPTYQDLVALRAEATKLDAEFLNLAIDNGAVLTGKPDGSESLSVVFTPRAWRSFAFANGVQEPAT